MTTIFDGLTLNLGIKLSDIFAGVGIFVAQFWPFIALGVAVTLAFSLGRKVIGIGKHGVK